MGRYSGKKCRLVSMFSMTTTFFLVELIVGYTTGSMALVADSFHMLSDVIALVVAFISIKMSPKEWSKNTFGWARAEVLGALINSVFLLALCFSIFVEAIQRLFESVTLTNPYLILSVGAFGLLINLIGLCLFRQHSHGHSHGAKAANPKPSDHQRHSNGFVVGEMRSNGHSEEDNTSSKANAKPKVVSSSSQLNMKGVFLHVLSDALGSVIVIISAIVLIFTGEKIAGYVDPLLSICLVVLITISTWPVLKDSAMILLQTVPTHIQVEGIEKQLTNIDGVLAVHEFHVWQLAGDRIIASAHIRCSNSKNHRRISSNIKQLFHDEGIHSTTIQLEFVDNNNEEPIYSHKFSTVDCILECPRAEKANCDANSCCRRKGLGHPRESRAPSLTNHEQHICQSSSNGNHCNCSPSIVASITDSEAGQRPATTSNLNQTANFPPTWSFHQEPSEHFTTYL